MSGSPNKKPGPPRRSRLDVINLTEAIGRALEADPSLKANEIYRRFGGRRRDVLRLVEAIKGPMSKSAGSSRCIGSQLGSDGTSGSAGDPS